MRYIKVLSMFMILVVALLLISTIRTYAGFTGAAIVQCDGDLEVIKAVFSDGDTDADCNTTGGSADCAPGDPCDDCLEECIQLGYSTEIPQTGSGKITYLLTSCCD